MRTASIKKRFKSAISRGTGETHLLMKQYPGADFSEEIMYAACHNLAYDPQCEGDRADYLYSLIDLTGKRDQMISAIISRLVKQKKDNFGLNQMCEIARLAHVNGFVGAREAVLRRYKKNGRLGYSECGNVCVREMEGAKALLLIANTVGQILRNYRGESENSYVVDEFQKTKSNINVWRILASEAKANENVRAYLHSILKSKRLSAQRRRRVPFTYLPVSNFIKNGRRFSIPLALRDLTTTDLEQLANDFLNETNLSIQAAYLQLFGQHKFPFGYARILEVARNVKSKDDRLQFFAIQALSLFKAEEVRQLFLDKMKTKSAYKYLPLLILNYKEGDQDLILKIIKEARNPDEIHSVAADLVDIYEANPTPDCLLPIEAVYEKLNCGFHREYLLNILVQQNILPDRIRQEMAYDCNIDIRNMVR